MHSDDGVIEAITHESLPFLGVQWHPEHPASARAQLTGLLRAVHRRGAARETQLARVSSRRA
ncbi:gamma-glutamyl-gamma-aminobutyrate hydrolase family protein [Microbacterium maritypicum]